MANRRKPAQAPARSDKPATLKDMLSPELVDRLKAQAETLKAEEERRKEAERLQAEAARKAEQKRLENDFEYLLEHSGMDWKKYK